MKKTATFLLLFISVSFINRIKAQQNLVPNPSFEDTTNCNYLGFYLEDFTANWKGGYGYYNPCQGSNHSVPANYVGYQNPKSGSAYCGITTKGNGITPAREYVQTKLTQQLSIGKKYKVMFNVSLADTLRAYTNSIGAYFSADSFFVSTTWLIEHIPQIQNNVHNNLGSKTDWTLVCDTIVAAGNEKYMTIGNFYTDSLSPLTPLDSICAQQPGNPACGAYYYLDDVSVELLDDTGLDEGKNEVSITILPNPNNGSFVITNHSHFNHQTTLIINNAFGQIIDQVDIVNSITNYQNTSLTNGLYFYTIRSKDQEIQRGKFLVAK